MGLNCSKGDLGQIEEKPAGATGTGLWELMEFPSLEISGQRGFSVRDNPSPGLAVDRRGGRLVKPSKVRL